MKDDLNIFKEQITTAMASACWKAQASHQGDTAAGCVRNGGEGVSCTFILRPPEDRALQGTG